MKKTTTKIFFSGILICLLLLMNGWTAKGQMVYVPDSMFRLKLSSIGYASCFTGDSIDASCPAVLAATSLTVAYAHIHDLQGIHVFVNLHSLVCSSDSLNNLPVLPNSLTNLSCNNNVLTSLPALPGGLINLYCSYNQLTTLPSLPNSIKNLDCLGNHLSSLPALPDSLYDFRCNNNYLTTLPSLPNAVYQLICSDNQLTTLPALPNSLRIIDCGNNQIVTFPLMPSSLKGLYCDNNHIQSLPALPDSLSSLDCTNNPLHSLPALNDSLRSLECGYDSLTSLPILPPTLSYLECGANQLTVLPSLPPTLTYLSCGPNQLHSLPPLPGLLNELNCAGNYLTTFPPFPNSLAWLRCQDNQLTSFPEFPDSMYFIDCYNNMTLHCLPRIKKIETFFHQNTSISCWPNYGNITTNYPATVLPLCGLFNHYGCDVLWNISGKTFFDANVNCNYDYNDVVEKNIKIKLFKNGNLLQQTFTTHDGNYSFDTDSLGTYEISIDTTAVPFSLVCPLNGSYTETLTLTDSLKLDRNFAFKCKNGFDLGVTSITGRFRPAHTSTVNIYAGDITSFYGAHCASGISGTVTSILNGPVSYVSPSIGALTPTSISGDTIVYTIQDFGAVNFNSDFNIIAATDTFATTGSLVCISTSVVSTIAGDNDTTNNFLSHCFIVNTSFDPNDKEVDPVGDLDVGGDRWLTYTIHFQNTGTANAEHIYILDTLDANLDLSTFHLLAYSHQPLVQILENGIARFNFPNINLPDSNSNEPASHGYVQYKIKLKSTATAGTQIRNTGYIYFDFNSPVATNTVVSNIINILGVNQPWFHESGIKIYPNPTTGEFTLSFTYHFGEKAFVKIYNLPGENIFEKNITVSPAVKISCSEINLKKGMYVVEIIAGNFSEKKKLIVQ